jgi:hypothetical protein
MGAVFENRRSGRERRKGERRRLPAEPAEVPGDGDRRSGRDRRQTSRRATDSPDAVGERYDHLWRNRWP